MNLNYPEGATPIEPDEAEGLLLTHITTRVELNYWEQFNIIKAEEWLKKTKPTKILNEQFIKKLHRVMFGIVWNWAGQFRKSGKNIGVPWYHISTSLKDLCDNTNFWIEQNDEPYDEIAVRFHHCLVSIHLFPNGNGRHARLMTDLLLENILGQPKFTWGRMNLNNGGDVRSSYITALKLADKGNYDPLRLFVRT